jgi:Zn-dependent peptidase ImmA (M78 family)
VKRSDYYEKLKELARRVRAEYGLSTPRVTRSDLRHIYKALKIRFDKWALGKAIRGAYFNDECGPSIVVDRSLPDDPAVFTMAHELKHHLVDGNAKLSFCSSANEKEPIEIGAEVFAAELLFPEEDFAAAMRALGVGPNGCTAEHIVRVKETTRTTLSHLGLTKRARWLGFATDDAFTSVRSWTQIRDQIFGVPFWRRRRRL